MAIIEECEGHEVYISKRYKPVAIRVKPVPGVFPSEASVKRNMPSDVLTGLHPLTSHPPEFVPTARFTQERMTALEINKDGFLWPEEEKLFKHVFKLNERVLAFEEADRGTFRDDYFTPYIIPTVPHVPWI